ncbi:hypothetical protein T484DRAFT_1823190 [Baffinella frigidus]|nr:hypothetical protein T484DRAFT_1823190 [Cryptophyta sp. CCMP2293]
MADTGSKRKREDGKHVGFGKLILFGEHFVVYKVPALVAAVADYTECSVKISEGKGVTIIDERPAVPGYKVSPGRALVHSEPQDFSQVNQLT